MIHLCYTYDTPIISPLHLYPPHPKEHHELAFLENIANESPVFRLFRQLCPYLHGKHHLEEIMWREYLNRKSVRLVLDTYRDFLVTVKHPQPEFVSQYNG